MAVTVLQQPTTPNVTNTNLVYTLSSSLAGSPQFRYVTDVYESGSGNYITTLKNYPNTSGNTNIDVSRILNDRLSYDEYWKITGSIAPVESVKTFDLRFGEEYGTSVSSSRTTYTGSSSNYLQVFPGNVYKNEGSFNFNTSSFDGPGNPYLTNDPAAQTEELFPDGDYAYLVNSTDYHTVTIFEDTSGTPASIQIRGSKLENGINTVVNTLTIPLTPPVGAFNTIGVGPQNLSDYTGSWANYIANGDINVIYSLNDPGGFVMYINDKWDGVPAKIFPSNWYAPKTFKQCSDEYTRFAFINQYGFWDYYNVYNPLRRVTNVNRSLYERPFVRYEDSQALYDISDRGNKQYKTEYTDQYEITTDFIDKPTGDWLTELFDSPSVYIQKNGQFIPVNILNTTVDWNMNENRQKLFQYTIQFKYANDRITR